MWNFCWEREEGSWINRITCYGNTCKQHVRAGEGKWSWLTAADNDAAIFIFVFGKGSSAILLQTTASVFFFSLNSASTSLSSVLEWNTTEEFQNTHTASVEAELCSVPVNQSNNVANKEWTDVNTVECL